MTKINGCLKCLFIFFNVVFAIIGCFMVYGAFRSTAYSHQMTAMGGPSLVWGWVFAIGMLGISCLGIYAGTSEKELPLKIFAGFMGVGMVIMMIFGIIVVVMRNKVRDGLTELTSPDTVRMYLDNDELRTMLIDLQRTADCCGVTAAADWGDEIPPSCTCHSRYSTPSTDCIHKPQGTRGPEFVHKQTCGEFIFMSVNLVFQISMGVCFGFAVTAFLGLLVSLFMIHQVRRYDNSGVPSIAMKGY